MQKRDQSDAHLLSAARGGDRAAFGELVRQYQDRVYSLAFRLAGNADLAEELAQESFLKAWRAIETFRGDSGFYTWVFRITVNEFRSQRRYASARLSPSSLDGNADGEHAVDPADKREDPVEEVARRERKQFVEAALLRLATDQRMLIVMRDIEGRDYEEIATLLDCPRGTVKSRLHRARMALKDLLAPQLGAAGM